MTGDFGIERNVLRQPVETELLKYVKPLAVALYEFLERLKRLIYRRVIVTHCSAPVILLIINCSFT